MKEELREKVTRGTPLFPCAGYKMESRSEDFLVACHWHNDIEITYVVSGEVEIMVDDITLCCHSGDIVFINSGSLHQYFARRKGVRYNTLVFSLQMLAMGELGGDIVEKLICKKTCLPTSLSADNTAYSALATDFQNAFENSLKGTRAAEMLAKAYLLTIIATLWEAGLLKTGLAGTAESPARRRAVEYISKNYKKQISVCDVAAAAGMSQGYFSFWFKRSFGVAFSKFLLEVRLDNAAKELAAERTVAEAAASSGFNNVSYFIKRFKESRGVTPHEYMVALKHSES